MPLWDQIQADGPAYHWPLTESAGTTAVNDGIIGVVGDGEYVGPTLAQGRGPSCGYSPNTAASFPGTTDSTMRVIRSLQTNATSAISIEAYVYLPSSLAGTSTPMMIVSHRSTALVSRQWFINTGDFSATGEASSIGYRLFNRITAPLGATTSPVVDVCYDRWNQVVMTWAPTSGSVGEGSIYWNGALVQGPVPNITNAWVTLSPGNWRFDIGHDGLYNYTGAPAYPFTGRVAQVAFYNGTALSAAQVLAHYNVMCGGCGSAKGVSILEFV